MVSYVLKKQPLLRGAPQQGKLFHKMQEITKKQIASTIVIVIIRKSDKSNGVALFEKNKYLEARKFKYGDTTESL